VPQILGYLFAALLSLGIWKTFAKVEQESNDRVRNSATAGQQRKFNSAVEKYASTYFTNLSAAATATVPVTITVAMLQDPTVNLLDASFGTLNPYGQTWQAQVLQPTSGTLRVMSYGAGGTALPDRTVASIAAMIGENGGFVPRNDSGAYPTGASAAIGSFGGWQASTSGYTGMVGGRTVALATLTNGQLVSNYLYRNAVPGQPQLNQMNTALGMSGNDINSVGKITNVSMNTSGDVKIAGKLDVTGTITTPANASAGVVDLENVSVENTACPKIGRQSRDSSGLPLSCQFGLKWKRSGLKEVSVVYGTVSYYGTWGTATCPAPTLLVGGGYAIVGNKTYPDGMPAPYNGTNSPDSSQPLSGTTWGVYAGGYPDFNFQSYAICAS
jgi:hypothetical protein